MPWPRRCRIDSIDDVFLIGEAKAVAEKIHRYVENGVTVPVVSPLTSTAAAAFATLQAIGKAWSP